MIKIEFKDGVKKEFEKGITGFDVVKSISEGLLRNSIAIKINDNLQDLSQPINNDCKIEILTTSDKESLSILRHTTAHVFSQAISNVYENSLSTIGPSTEEGFFYDIDCENITEENFKKIEDEMKKIIKEKHNVEIVYKTESEAKEFFKNNKYKLQIIENILNKTLKEDESLEGDFNDGKLKFYKQGEFMDICSGPHLPNLSFIKAFKLEKITKAYWRGDSKNVQLNRFYGTAFFKQKDLEEFLEFKENVKKRDHRIIGKKLNLFMHHKYSPGSTFFLDKGYFIYRKLQEFLRSIYKKYDYKEVNTPNIFNKKLWEISGHWQHYKDDMFLVEVDKQECCLKPMNCPSHCLIFKNELKSYRDLPLRIADFGALHRNELSGALSGLTRVRKFCQDDGHIFCEKSQIGNEINNIIEIIDTIYKKVFKMDYEIELSTRPEKYLGDLQTWDLAEDSLKKSLKNNNKEFEICEGDGAFYGPKIDFRIKDCLNRVWQVATIQLDFNLPNSFELEYKNKEDKMIRPVMIHRALLGSFERFIGILIEHFEGKFPLWLSPNQIQIINIADRHVDYCLDIKKQFVKEDFNVSTSFDNVGVGKKIAIAREENKPNYMVIIGDEDMEKNQITIRSRKMINGKNESYSIKLNEFLELIKKERDSKEINY